MGSTLPPTIVPAPSPNFQRTRAGLARVANGFGRMRIGCIGDSTTAGYGSTSGDTGYALMQPNAWPTQLAKFLTAAGYSAEVASAMGDNGVLTGLENHPTADSRISMGANWTTSASSATLGGNCYYFPANGGVAPLTFNPGTTFDTIRIWFGGNPVNGTASVSIGGGSLGTVNTGVGASLGHTDIACTRGQNTVTLTPSSSGQLLIMGIECWDSTTPKVQIFNFGVNGAHVADKLVATNPWSAKNFIGGFAGPNAVDLWICCLDINNSNQQTGVPQYQADYTTLVQTCMGAGALGSDVLLIGGVPSGSYEAFRPAYIAAEQQVAGANNSSFLDQFTIWGSEALSNIYGVMYDNVHPNRVGQGMKAGLIARKMLSL